MHRFLSKSASTRLRSRLSLPFRLPLAAVVAIVAGGCQSYERRPLDMRGHEAAFLARTPESPEVQRFAASLVARTPESSEGEVEFDPADGISSAEAEVIALVFNADLRLARLRAGITRATAENAGLWADPTIGVDLGRIIDSTPEPWKVFASVGLTIPLSGRLEIEKQRAGAEHAAELARVLQREWSVRVSVRRVWSEWSALEARFVATRDFLARVDQILSIVDAMERAGEMARTEARLFRIERVTRMTELVALEARATQAELLLRQVMGMSPDAPLRFQASGIGPVAIPDVPGGNPGMDAAALQARSPALLVVVAEYEAAERALQLEVRRQYPDLQIGPGYGQDEGQSQILLGLSLPIPILNANRQGIAVAQAQREVARANAQATLEQVFAGLRSLEARREGAARRRQALEFELVPLVDAQYADARQVARLGEVNTLILLESLTRQQDAKTALIEARLDEALAGVEVQGVLGPTPSPAPQPALDAGPAPAAPAPASADPSSPAPPASGGNRR